ncbi:hypothetical protein GCM10027026_00370 [Myroides odoratimimus subsp. xuanwuensis]
MRVAAFAAGLVVAFGAAFGAGRVIGPLDEPAEEPGQHTTYQQDEGQHDEGGTHDE